MSRTIDDYDSMARREIIKAKQEKATSYVLFLVWKKKAILAIHRSWIPRPCRILTISTDECKSSRLTMPNFGKSLSGSRKRWVRTQLSSLTNNLFYTPQRATAQRTELFSTSTSTPLTADARRRFASSTSPEGTTTTEAPENPFRDGMLGASREDYALHEHSFLQGAEARLDDFLAQGREVLDNLVDQRTMLKGTQRRLRDAANTLGLSRDVIGWIDRRR
jgi:golgi SNAP receptor complex member 2